MLVRMCLTVWRGLALTQYREPCGPANGGWGGSDRAAPAPRQWEAQSILGALASLNRRSENALVRLLYYIDSTQLASFPSARELFARLPIIGLPAGFGIGSGLISCLG
jgi:hypothetical protein